MRFLIFFSFVCIGCFASTTVLDFNDLPGYSGIIPPGYHSSDGIVFDNNCYYNSPYYPDLYMWLAYGARISWPGGINSLSFRAAGFSSNNFQFTVTVFDSTNTQLGTFTHAMQSIGNPVTGTVHSFDWGGSTASYIIFGETDFNGTPLSGNGNYDYLTWTVDECPEENGALVPIGTKNYCSCFSGYTGDSCLDTVTSHAPLAVSDSIVNFPVDLSFVYQTTTSPQLIVTVPSTNHKYNKATGDVGYSTTTLIKFGGAERKCDYLVHSGWEVTAVGSNDVYTGTFSWSDLSDCGLTSVIDGDYTKFSNTLKFTRNFVINNGRFEIEREVSQEDEFSVRFPNRISAHSEVIVADNTVNAFAAISSVNYDPITNNGQWSVKIKTIVAFPYKLRLKNDYDTDPIGSRSPTLSTTVVETDCTTDDDEDCNQVFTFTFPDCQGLAWTDWDLNFQPICRAGIAGNDKTPDLTSECASPNGVPANSVPFVVTTSLTTSDACSVDKTYDIGTPILTSYTSNSFNTPTTLFGTSETAYFTIDFTLPPATISVKSVDTVCAYPIPVADPGEDPVYPAICPAEKSLTSDQWDDETANLPVGSTAELAFSANGGDLKTASGVTDTNHFIVHADIVLTYSGGLTKRATLIKQYAGDVKLVIHDDRNAVASPNHSSASTFVVGCGLLFACLLV